MSDLWSLWVELCRECCPDSVNFVWILLKTNKNGEWGIAKNGLSICTQLETIKNLFEHTCSLLVTPKHFKKKHLSIFYQSACSTARASKSAHSVVPMPRIGVVLYDERTYEFKYSYGSELKLHTMPDTFGHSSCNASFFPPECLDIILHPHKPRHVFEVCGPR
jgi:hypothetical protein